MKILLLVLLFSVVGLASEKSILSFKEWKSHQVQEAIMAVTNLRKQMELTREEARQKSTQKSAMVFGEVLNEKVVGVEFEGEEEDVVKDKEVELAVSEGGLNLNNLESKLIYAQLRLETANSLSVADYLNIYAFKLPQQNEFLQVVANKMSKEEMVEVMKAYRQQMEGAREVPSSLGSTISLGRSSSLAPKSN